MPAGKTRGANCNKQCSADMIILIFFSWYCCTSNLNKNELDVHYLQMQIKLNSCVTLFS